MHVRLRLLGKPEAIIVVESKLSKIDHFRRLVNEKFNVKPKLQRLIYCGKELENGYTFHDYSIKVNDVIQLIIKAEPTEDCKTLENEEKKSTEQETKIIYNDAKSILYAIGDLVDARDFETGAWFEGKLIRIVSDPKESTSEQNGSQTEINHENVSPNINNSSNAKKNGIQSFFGKAATTKGKNSKKEKSETKTETGLLYQVQMDADEESQEYYKLKDIRPRARHIIDIQDLKVGQCVMINHNTEDVTEKGYWYDFKVSEIKKLQKSHELIGTLYLGAEAVPQHDTKVRLLDRIYAIEEVVPLDDRNNKYYDMVKEEPDKRSQPLNCLTCRDNESAPCKDCGCFKCLGKNDPDKIILCDECNHGYHMRCLPTPLVSLPSDDWFCPGCKREEKVAKQTKKVKNTTRDWGRGMACVGKTKTCAMPANHFGPIPGIEVGMRWRFRIQLSETGVHRPPVSGIHGRDVEGAYSIVLSGGYEDDYDNGTEFTYTGSGGRDLSGNKRTADQSCDQTLTRENKALARNCAVPLSEGGADAGDKWRDGRPVRVVRSYKMIKHFPEYAPAEGIRYDGIYKVVKYYPEKGKSGFVVWKYLLRRDDPTPAPWEPQAKQYQIVYPDGYLEAEAEKRAQKEKSKKTKRKSKLDESDNEEEMKKTPKTRKNKRKSAVNDNSDSENDKISVKIKKPKRKVIKDSSDDEAEKIDKSPDKKKRKVNTPDSSNKKLNGKSKARSVSKSPKKKIRDMFSSKSSTKEEPLTQLEKDAILADLANYKLWQDCMDKCHTMGKKHFIEHVTEVFKCIICQDVVSNPVTTPCLHNFCMWCLKLAYKSTGSHSCPCCRGSLSHTDLQQNNLLLTALRTLMPGYDAGKK